MVEETIVVLSFSVLPRTWPTCQHSLLLISLSFTMTIKCCWWEGVHWGTVKYLHLTHLPSEHLVTVKTMGTRHLGSSESTAGKRLWLQNPHDPQGHYLPYQALAEETYGRSEWHCDWSYQENLPSLWWTLTPFVAFYLIMYRNSKFISVNKFPEVHFICTECAEGVLKIPGATYIRVCCL